MKREMRSLEITEKQWAQQVVDLSRQFGWKVYRTWNSIHSPAGFPDIVAVKDSELLVVELKSEKGKLTETQKEWLSAFQLTCARVFVWRPSDFEEVVAILRGIIILEVK